MTLKLRMYAALHSSDETLTKTQRFLLLAIVSAVVLAIVGTEPTLPPRVDDLIELVEVGFGVLFTVEYVLRVWSIDADAQFSGIRGRLRYMRQPLVIIDFLALLPFLFGLIGGESLILRSIRVLRLLALTKLFRYSEAMRVVMGALYERRHELVFAFALSTLMILLSSAALYAAEGVRQPEAFGSIPRAMWWAIATLTTVGYGDVVPVTPIGKVLAALTAISGIGMIAMPTGILAASFSDGFARARGVSSASSKGATSRRRD
jgi:voltage-gated potassium channel